jgi:DNA-binding response OmpR family regulator
MEPQKQPSDGISIAVLEDDAILRDLILVPKLREYGFTVAPSGTASELYAQLLQDHFDLAILDIGLPDANGFQVAQKLRTTWPDMGIVILTGRGGVPDRVRGLSEGADAYLPKPVEIELLVATLCSLARRLKGSQTATSKDWRLDQNGWRLLNPGGVGVTLTDIERLLLLKLIETPGVLVTRETLIEVLTSNVYDFDPHRLDNLVYRLRRKVMVSVGEPVPISAIYGKGYVLVAG